jgi:hypothetical protein
MIGSGGFFPVVANRPVVKPSSEYRSKIFSVLSFQRAYAGTESSIIKMAGRKSTPLDEKRKR